MDIVERIVALVVAAAFVGFVLAVFSYGYRRRQALQVRGLVILFYLVFAYVFVFDAITLEGIVLLGVTGMLSWYLADVWERPVRRFYQWWWGES